ncbi:hypothetical protein [Kribbella italica]|uniref:Uncharacterized protein n=1 Tax=Kribbella italica TaxID=1540520 RepID=A0A7W9J4C7_9ACTN|nr:hypothetical protein [Kribbella italica]MBB5834910.1 hypothetical protein [Kribbella italica]
MTDPYAEINGHRVIDLHRVTSQGRFAAGPVCIRCDTHFADLQEIADTACPVPFATGNHDLLVDPDDGLLYCTQCPLVAYDLADAAGEEPCSGPVHNEQRPRRSDRR